MKPIYDIRKTYMENLVHGPFFSGSMPKRMWPGKDNWIDFLGFKLASSIGIPAGPLLDSKWIRFAGAFGYDLVTYKTIRCHEHPSHPLPNIVPVRTKGQLIPEELPDNVALADQFQSIADETIGITNSFGNPSRSPDFLKKDIPQANDSLKEGQALIVSIFGTSRKGIEMIDDFVETARLAKEYGAKLIEANFSCPNVSNEEGSLYSSAEAVYAFSSRIVKAIGDVPLIIKTGVFSSHEKMKQVFTAAARAGVRAICGINTISMKVVNASGRAALGPNRISSGICGNPIRDAALDYIRMARNIIDGEKLDLGLMSTGGVTLPEHFQLFLDAGADIAMTATGMMWDPYLAMKYHEEKQEKYHASGKDHHSTF